MHPLTVIVGVVGIIALIVCPLVWFLKVHVKRSRTKEERETEAGLGEIGRRTGTKWGSSASVEEDVSSDHGSSSGSGDAGGGGDQ